MVNIDFGFWIKQLSERLSVIEDHLNEIDCANKEMEDWDNAKLLREWGICRRTAAYYRQHGLGYYKRGGRIYYTRQHREEFIAQKKS